LTHSQRQDRHLSCLRVSLTQSQRQDRLCQTSQTHDICLVFESKTDLDKTRQSSLSCVSLTLSQRVSLTLSPSVSFTLSQDKTDISLVFECLRLKVKSQTRQNRQKDICFVFEPKTDVGSRLDIQRKTVHPTPRGVTLSNAVSKLKAQSSNVSFTTFQ